MDPQTVTVAHRQAAAADKAEREALNTIRWEMAALVFALGFAAGTVFATAFIGRL